MTAFPSYSTGTVAIGANATSVVGTGSNWTGQNAMAGDLLVVGADSVIISDVTDALHLAIDAWPFAAVTAGTAYKIYKVSPLRFVGAQTAVQVDQLVSALDTNGFYVFVPPDASVPDPSLGQDEQYALQATTGKLWQKTGGTWNFIGTQKGFGVPASWNSATAYLPFNVATLDGSSYVCILANTNETPPNATYWVVLASKGDTGASGPAALLPVAAWLTATSYVVGPPASLVSNAGASYECLITHTSGTFATDLAAGKWGLVAAAGTNGTNGTNGLSYGGTSATSNTIGTGSKTFAGVGTSLAYQIGDYVRAHSVSAPGNYIEGNVSAYASGSITINATLAIGTGTFTDWALSVSASPSSIPNGAIRDSSTAELLTYQSISSGTRIPVDDTIPQSSEGIQILSVTITPKTVTNKLRVRYFFNVTVSGADNIAGAIFLNSETNARAANHVTVTSGTATTFLEHEFVPGIITSCTIALRVGSDNSLAFYINGNAGGRAFGGVRPCLLVVEEIAA